MNQFQRAFAALTVALAAIFSGCSSATEGGEFGGGEHGSGDGEDEHGSEGEGEHRESGSD